MIKIEEIFFFWGLKLFELMKHLIMMDFLLFILGERQKKKKKKRKRLNTAKKEKKRHHMIATQSL